MLSQDHDDSLERVVAYASRALGKEDRRYSVTRTELLGVVSFLHYFQPYCCGDNSSYEQTIVLYCGQESLRNQKVNWLTGWSN